MRESHHSKILGHTAVETVVIETIRYSCEGEVVRNTDVLPSHLLDERMKVEGVNDICYSNIA